MLIFVLLNQVLQLSFAIQVEYQSRAHDYLLIFLLVRNEDSTEAQQTEILPKPLAVYPFLISWNIKWKSHINHLEVSWSPAIENKEPSCPLNDSSFYSV